MITRKVLALVLLFTLLTGCSPTPEMVATAIAQTQDAELALTPTTDQEALVQTAIAGTQALTATAEMLATMVDERVISAVAGTLTALPPPATATPAETATAAATATKTAIVRPSITNTPEPIIPSGPISLIGVENQGAGKVKLTWEAEGSFADGFAVVWATTNPEPAYPNDYWVYFGNGKARSAVVDVQMANVYFFRVCEYIRSGSRCENYSNAEALAVN